MFFIRILRISIIGFLSCHLITSALIAKGKESTESSWQAEYQQGLQFIENGELDSAEKHFLSFRKRHRNLPEAYHGLGLVYYARDPSSKDALKNFEQAIRKDRNFGKGYYHLGLVYMHQKNRMFEAREQFRIAVQKDPSLIEAWSRLGQAEGKLWPYGSGLVGIYAEGVKNVPESRVLYSHFINSAIWQEKEDEAIKLLEFLKEHGTSQRSYDLELANLHFDIDKTEKSVKIVNRLLQESPDISDCRLNLLQAKIHFDLDKPEEGLAYYAKAVESIEDSIDAMTIFNDAKYLMHDREFDILQRTPIDSLVDFYARFWRARDPNLATTPNEAVVEFYNRLTYAKREYRLFIPGYDLVEFKYARLHPYREFVQQGQALLDAADLPHALRGGREIDDLGLIYVRHGEPDHVVVSPDGLPFGVKEPEYLNKIFAKSQYYGNLPDVYLFEPGGTFTRVPNATAGESLYEPAYFANIPSNQSYRYDATANRPTLFFHFKKWDGETAWMMETLPYAVAGREVFDEGYGVLGRESFGGSPDRTRIAWQCKRLHEVSLNSVRVGLETMTFDYDLPAEPLPFPFMFKSYRAESGNVEVEIYYAISGRHTELVQGLDENYLDLYQFIGVYNEQWDEVVRLETSPKIPLDIELDDWQNRATMAMQSFTLPPGSYLYAVHLRDNSSGRESAYRGHYSFPAFKDDTLQVSDVLLSSAMVPTDEANRFRKGNVAYGPRMFSAFVTGSMAGLYCEAYNLKVDSSSTRFQVNCSLRLRGEEGPFENARGFFRRVESEEPFVANTGEVIVGDRQEEEFYVNLELGDRPPGDYDVLVEVTDLNAGTKTSTSTSVMIR